MAPQSRNVDVISVMTESSTGMTVSNCLRVELRALAQSPHRGVKEKKGGKSVDGLTLYS